MQPSLRNTIAYLLLIPAAAPATAAEWKIDPTISFRAGYNDNIRLFATDEVSSAEATLSPSTIFGWETATSGLNGNLRFNFRRFSESRDLDENNVRLDVKSFHQMERSRVGLDIGLIKDSTLDSQLEDSGLVFDRIERIQASAAPDWTYRLTERSDLNFTYEYSDIRYDNAGDSGLVDFTINSAQISMRSALSEQTLTSVTLALSKSDNENDVSSRNGNISAGLVYQFSETLSASLSVGGRYTKTDFSQNSLIPIFSNGIVIGFFPLTRDQSRSSSGATFRANLTKSFLRGNTTISASRNISNSINGTPIEVTRLNWNTRYRLSEVLSTRLNLQLYNSDASDSVGDSLNRNYYVIEPGLNWDFRKFWSLSATYRYRKQTFDDTSNDATQNAAYLTLIYRWPRIAVSR